jgi:tetratricopeptide (TPR) repeat protein
MMSSQNNGQVDLRYQNLLKYVLTAIVSAAMGATLTWLLTSQHSGSQVRPISSALPSAIINPMPDVSGMSPGEAALTLGNFAYDHQRWTEAIRRYEEAIASGIDNADVHTDLGNAFRFSGQPEQALNQYTIAQKLNPQHENSLFNQISLFTEVLRDPVHAIPLCEEFIRRFPSSDKLSAVQQQLSRAKAAAP